MNLTEAIAQLERRRVWLETQMTLGRSELGDRAEMTALDVALPILREEAQAAVLHSVRVPA